LDQDNDTLDQDNDTLDHDNDTLDLETFEKMDFETSDQMDLDDTNPLTISLSSMNETAEESLLILDQTDQSELEATPDRQKNSFQTSEHAKPVRSSARIKLKTKVEYLQNENSPNFDETEDEVEVDDESDRKLKLKDSATGSRTSSECSDKLKDNDDDDEEVGTTRLVYRCHLCPSQKNSHSDLLSHIAGKHFHDLMLQKVGPDKSKCRLCEKPLR
jgi:hypothetical protein